MSVSENFTANALQCHGLLWAAILIPLPRFVKTQGRKDDRPQIFSFGPFCSIRGTHIRQQQKYLTATYLYFSAVKVKQGLIQV